jgi:alpha-beta hydrolase superfamily lysophospholipase
MDERANLVTVQGTEHWTRKGDVRLFLWRKSAVEPRDAKGTILFVHGSSMASQPTFDLHVPGRPDSSAMDWFVARGFDTWCMDNEGYGRSDKQRPINCDIANGADDLAEGAEYITRTTGVSKLVVYGISSGALKAALFAAGHPERVARSTPLFGPVRAARPWPSGGRGCLSFNPSTAAPSIVPLCAVFSIAIIRVRRTRQRSIPSRTRSSRSMTRCRPGLTLTCA